MKLLGKCVLATEMGDKEDKEDLFVGGSQLLYLEISCEEVERSQGRNILKADQSEISLNTKVPKMKIETILTWRHLWWIPPGGRSKCFFNLIDIFGMRRLIS